MIPIFRFSIFLATTLFTVRANAQHMNQKEFPCANVVVTTELTECLSKAKDRADVKLNSVYKDIRGRLENADVERLTKTQRLWIRYRDANCSAERDLYEGGTAKYPVYFACLESLTSERIRELQVTYAAR